MCPLPHAKTPHATDDDEGEGIEETAGARKHGASGSLGGDAHEPKRRRTNDNIAAAVGRGGEEEDDEEDEIEGEVILFGHGKGALVLITLSAFCALC